MKIKVTKDDVILWSSKHPEVPAELYKKGFTATVNGKEISFVPVLNVKTPALKPDKASPGLKEFTKAPYGTVVEFTTK